MSMRYFQNAGKTYGYDGSDPKQEVLIQSALSDGWPEVTGNWPPSPTLAQAQDNQVQILSSACASAIVAGFSSSALGSAHTYPSQPNDQSNLIGAATVSQTPGLPSTWTCNFWCADSTGAWALRPHTAAQTQQVLAAGLAAREALSAKLAGLVAQVDDATTVASVQAIVW